MSIFSLPVIITSSKVLHNRNISATPRFLVKLCLKLHITQARFCIIHLIFLNIPKNSKDTFFGDIITQLRFSF
jgi:hypothetical protein